MSKSSSYEKFILGPGPHQLNGAEYKRVMLTGYLSVLSLIISVFYALLDFYNGIYYSMPGYVLLVLTSFIVFASLRKKKYSLAKILLMANANLVVFFAAINDPPATGTCMFFIPAGTGSFAMFGFQERSKPILIAFFSVGLFVLAFFGNIQVPHTTVSAQYIVVSFIVNFIISLTIIVSMLYFLGSLNEISEKGLMEKEQAERVKNDQLVKINSELDRFIYSISHDLKSPLSSIQGLAAVGKLSSNPEEMKQCFSFIEDRVKAQEYFIGEIIEIYRNNRVDLKPEKINIGRLVDEVIKEASFEPGANKIKFMIDIHDNVLVTADKIRLKSILFNLFGNAIKYHDSAKTEQFIKVGATENDSAIEIIVEDNGRGIEPEHLPKIFDMFYRASTDSKGSGLGLYIVKEIAEKMNATISVESGPGNGTQFRLRFNK